MWAIASLGLTTGNKQLAVTFRPAEANDNIDFRDWQGHLILAITHKFRRQCNCRLLSARFANCGRTDVGNHQ
jgi:hypothetical protein